MFVVCAVGFPFIRSLVCLSDEMCFVLQVSYFLFFAAMVGVLVLCVSGRQSCFLIPGPGEEIYAYRAEGGDI